MNLILLFKEDFVNGTGRARLQGRRLEHVLRVHRARAGDDLKVGLCGGKIGRGRIILLSEQCLEMDVALEEPAPPILPVTLAVALPRPAMLKRVLSCASAMGVKKILLFHSSRVEKSFWRSPALSRGAIHEQLVLGLEQACDTALPDVRLFTLFKPFVEDELPTIARGTRAFVGHPEAREACPGDIKEPATLVIGPEGGFVPFEINLLVSQGFVPVNIGKRILRVETAVPAFLSKMFY
ncbi:MAG: 16S rRNA (uracil(1498)-N(3))-methyltransferase [Omnitrophica WOR_2 bacterium RIFCSPHIGHO2_02_FULL_52_10]|nr:MAG: 16S rRNA (uracil(1498)-N(3))-methyltransferase [Omnitrophica WOR_2 bacterium RIFCSPHIGHO2_02_FULL_52_10]